MSPLDAALAAPNPKKAMPTKQTSDSESESTTFSEQREVLLLNIINSFHVCEYFAH